MRTYDQPLYRQLDDPEHVDVLVVGAGQAGLALGWHLRQQDVGSFLLLDAAPELGYAWQSRWDSLRLFTPAEYDGLPGFVKDDAAWLVDHIMKEHATAPTPG